jgi:hypothetical protein
VRRVAADPTGRFLATGGDDGTVAVRNWVDGRVLASLRRKTLYQYPLKFSPDGSLLCVPWDVRDCWYRVTGRADGTYALLPFGHTACDSMALSEPLGTVAGVQGATLIGWDARTGAERYRTDLSSELAAACLGRTGVTAGLDVVRGGNPLLMRNGQHVVAD